VRRSVRAPDALFYGGLALEVAGAAWGLTSAAAAPPVRVAPLLLGYALMVLGYGLWRRTIRRWAEPASAAVWDRIGQRLLADRDLDEDCEPDPAVRARFRRADAARAPGRSPRPGPRYPWRS